MVRIFAKLNSTQRAAKYIRNREDIRAFMGILNRDLTGDWVYIADLGWEESILFDCEHNYQGFAGSKVPDYEYNKGSVIKL